MAEQVLGALRVADVHGHGLIPCQDLSDILAVLGIQGDLLDGFQSCIQANPGSSVDYAKFVHWLFLGSVPENALWYRVIASGGATLRQDSHKLSPSVGKLGGGSHFAAFHCKSRGEEAWLRTLSGWLLAASAEPIAKEVDEAPGAGEPAPWTPLPKQRALIDPPAVAAPAPLGLTTPPEANVQVEGAVGDLENCNGAFVRHKIYNGKHKYRNTANQKAIIFFDSCWKMRENDDESDWSFHLPYKEWALHEFHTQAYDADVPFGVWLHKHDTSQSVRVFERRPPHPSDAEDASSNDVSEAVDHTADSPHRSFSASPSTTGL